MKQPRRLSHCSGNSINSKIEEKQMKMKTKVLMRLKYIHNRILDHIKMKNFLEGHEIRQFLGSINKLITNFDEIEAFRKRIKNMLLNINDSIMEFEQAISSGEITFSSLQIIKDDIHKNNVSSSGVSTLDESPSLTSLVLTNSNFLTIPDEQSVLKTTQSQFLRDGIEEEMSVKPTLSSINLSSFALTDENFNISDNFMTGYKSEGKQNENYFKTSNSQKLMEDDNQNKYIQTCQNIQWKKKFQTLKNNETPMSNVCNNRSDTEHNISESNQSSANMSQDLFIEPAPVMKIKKRCKMKTNTNFNHQKISMENHKTTSYSKQKHISIPKTIYISETENENINFSTNSIPQKSFFKKVDVPQQKRVKTDEIEKNELDSSNLITENVITSDSEHSEIFFMEQRTLQNSETGPKVKNCIHNCDNFEKKNNLEQNLELPFSGVCKNTFSQITQCENSYHSDNHPKGIKRRVLDTSTNLQMINGHFISHSADKYTTEINHNDSVISSSASLCSNQLERNNRDLESELQEAAVESSMVLKELVKLLDQEKRQYILSKKCLVDYNCGDLRFPSGYEEYYGYLENILVEFKTTVGLKTNIYQPEKQCVYFEDAMNDWTELREIIEKIN